MRHNNSKFSVPYVLRHSRPRPRPPKLPSLPPCLLSSWLHCASTQSHYGIESELNEGPRLLSATFARTAFVLHLLSLKQLFETTTHLPTQFARSTREGSHCLNTFLRMIRTNHKTHSLWLPRYVRGQKNQSSCVEYPVNRTMRARIVADWKAASQQAHHGNETTTAATTTRRLALTTHARVYVCVC